MSERVTGTVKWFNNARGYGFVNVDGDENEIEFFVHYSSIDMEGYKTLKPNSPISFILLDTPKGVQATEVELL